MKKGFSLIEILVVIGIMAAIFTISVEVFPRTLNKESLNKDSSIILSTLNDARNKSINSVNNLEHGVHFTATNITLFEGKSYIYSNTSNVISSLENGITISSINFTNGGVDVYFNRITGEPSASGTITVLNSKNNSNKIINIRSTGLIDMQ